jgi:hypothetical protein
MNISGDMNGNYQVEVSGQTVNASGQDMGVIQRSDFIVENGLDVHLDDLKEVFDDRIADLQAQIDGSDNPAERMALSDEIMHLENVIGGLEDDLQSVASGLIESGQFTMIDLRDNPELVFDAAADGVCDLISDYRAQISESYANFGTDGLTPGPSLSGDSPKIDPSVAGALSGVNESAEDGTGGVDAAGGGEGGADLEEANVDGASAEELVNMLSTDPDAFMEEMQNLDPEERGATMMMVQQQLQQINQMFSMMSQFSQSIHDTQKAVIQNLRV